MNLKMFFYIHCLYTNYNNNNNINNITNKSYIKHLTLFVLLTVSSTQRIDSVGVEYTDP